MYICFRVKIIFYLLCLLAGLYKRTPYIPLQNRQYSYYLKMLSQIDLGSKQQPITTAAFEHNIGLKVPLLHQGMFLFNIKFVFINELTEA